MNVKRIRASGRVGSTAGFYWFANVPAAGDIDIDNDGVIGSPPQFLLDLSRIASLKLGKQMPLMGSVKLNSFRIGLRHVDDVTDNEEEAAFAGRMLFYPPTDHVVKALQLARKVEKADESTEVNGDSLFLTTETDYAGFRYGWNELGTVTHQTSSGVTGVTSWNLEFLRSVYNSANAVPQNNALFTGRFPEASSFQWSASAGSGSHGDDGQGGTAFEYRAHFTDDVIQLNHHSLPLLYGAVEYSSVDEDTASQVDHGIDDDYYLWCEVDFTYGGAF